MPIFRSPRTEVATFPDLPAANSVPVGRTYTVLADGSQWRTDGAWWRPANGRRIVSQMCGSLTNPIATITGATAADFVLPAVPTFPAGMLAPMSRVVVEAMVRRLSSTATAILAVRLGTSGGAADSAVWESTLSATANQDSRVLAFAAFGSARNAMTVTNPIIPNSVAVGGARDRAPNVNPDAQMSLSIGVVSANAADTFALWYLGVFLES